MSKNSDLASIRLKTEHELSDAFALAGLFLSRAKTSDKDFPFEFSTELFAAVSLEIAYKEGKGSFKDVLDYIADPEWNSTKDMLSNANLTMSDYGRLLVAGHIKTKETHWAHSFSRKISDIPTEVAALSLVRQCYAHWLEALQAYYSHLDALAVKQEQDKRHAVQFQERMQAQRQEQIDIPAISAMDELHKMIGLTGVKSKISDLVDQAKANKVRKERGYPEHPLSMNLLFTGNSGTGKTTVAKLIGKIYADLGLLKRGHCVEVNRAKLIGTHIGQTTDRTVKYINEAENGVLFIDEAYNLVKEGSPADFGQEAIDELLTAMVDKKDCMAVIVAGYKVPMEKFIASNPGLPSRFKTEIEFEDYDPDALEKILHQLLFDLECRFDDEVKKVMRKQIENMYHSRNVTSFGNARDIGNFFEDISANQSRRLNKNKSQDTQQILQEDIPDIYPSHLAPCGDPELKQAGEML